MLDTPHPPTTHNSPLRKYQLRHHLLPIHLHRLHLSLLHLNLDDSFEPDRLFDESLGLEEAETQRTEQEDLDDSNLLFEIICEGLTVDATNSSLAEKSLTAWLVSINPGNRYIMTTFYNSIWETLESQLNFDLTHEAQLLSIH